MPRRPPPLSRSGRDAPDYYGNPGGLTEEAEVVRAIYDAFARRDLDAVLRHLSPDCELHLIGTGRIAGRTEPYRGHEGMREYFADVERVWEALVLHADDFRIIPGSVIVIGHVTGRRDGLDVRRSAVGVARQRWTRHVRESGRPGGLGRSSLASFARSKNRSRILQRVRADQKVFWLPFTE